MPRLYRHYKNNYYQEIGEALNTEDDSVVVVYRTLYPSEYTLFTRPKAVFHGKVLLADGSECLRFTPVAFDDLPEEAKLLVIQEVPVA